MPRGARAVPETLAVFLAVFGLERSTAVTGLGPAAFALSLPLSVHPWTVATSVYAHASVGHLLANAVAFLVVGLLVARRTSRVRFHAFVLSTGALSGVATVALGSLLGQHVAVLGASGAIMALIGYLLAGNLATETLLGRVRLPRRAWVVVVVALAAGVAVVTAGPHVAVTAHVTGFLVGVATGRRHVLQAA